MIQIDGLTKQFGDHMAVDRLSLEINQGEVFGFLGPNGAGKTTTIRMLTSLIGPTSGTAVINGMRLGEDDHEIRLMSGILTETPGLYDRLSARRNLEIYARLYEVEQVDKQIQKYLTLLGLWERRNEPAGSYSKGMRQKLAIARALLHEPRVLYLDEPTSGLDPEAAKVVREFITELRDDGRTIFICTHNLDEADRLCDRVAVFKTHLRVVDSPARLRQQAAGRQVVFHLGQAADGFIKPIAQIDYVNDVSATDNKLLVTLDSPEIHNPALVRALIAEQADIQFIGEIRHSLEDAYLELVQ